MLISYNKVTWPCFNQAKLLVYKTTNPNDKKCNTHKIVLELHLRRLYKIVLNYIHTFLFQSMNENNIKNRCQTQHFEINNLDVQTSWYHNSSYVVKVQFSSAGTRLFNHYT